MNSEKQSTNLQMILREVNRVGEGQKNVPKLRFKGYEDAWEQRILMNILSEYTDEVNALENGYVRLGIRSHAKGTFHTFVQEGKELQTGKMYKVAANKFIVNITFAWEHAVAVTNQNDEGKIVSHRFPQFTISDDVIPDFFKYIILNKQFKYYLGLSSPGGAGRNRVLNIKEMLKYEVRIATESEQEQIYKILSGIDNLITLHQRKYDALKTMKKTLLSKMFPKDGEDVPEIRFKGFTDAWEQRKVSEITKFHKQGYYTTEEYNDNKKYYLLRGTDLTGNKLVLKDTPKINASEKDYDAFKTEIGDFLIVRSGNVGTYGIVDIDIPAIFGSYLIDFRFDTEKVTNEFFGYFYQSERFQSQLNKITQSSANININAENIKSTYISLPVLTEQKKISNIMSTLDNCITLHQRKLDELKNMKKTLLQQMFV